MASSREDWQAIGKRRQAVGKRSSESRGRIGEFARRTHAENSRRTSLGNLLASHRGEVRPKAAEVQNHSRYGNCSFSPSFPALAPSPSPRYGGVEPGSKSGPPPSSPIGSFGDDDIKKTFIHRRVGLPANSPRCEAGKFSSGRRTQILRSMILAANSPNLPLPPTTASLLFHATCLVAVSQLLHAG